MKTLFGISGSASQESSNTQLLHVLRLAFAETYDIQVLDRLWELPLYTPETERAEISSEVTILRKSVAQAEAIIICTPEYLHNIPAVLKNALEWMTTSGELAEKPVLAVTFTPAPPRGKHAMQSLLQSLGASKARVVAELPLFRSELTTPDNIISLNEANRLLIAEALALL